MDQSKSSSADQQVGSKHTTPSRNIVDTAIASGQFTTLIAGIKAAGLTSSKPISKRAMASSTALMR
jgi:hypothetical protein